MNNKKYISDYLGFNYAVTEIAYVGFQTPHQRTITDLYRTFVSPGDFLTNTKTIPIS